MVNKIDKCPWEKIESFQSPSEFENFISWMQENISERIATKINVAKKYRGIETLKEEWFLHNASNTIWRLVWPDPPFTGLFEQVK